MRKTLVALAVVISVVLLQAPAWAPTTTTRKPRPPNIYVVQGGSNPNAKGATRTVDVVSDACRNKRLVVTFTWGETLVGKTTKKNGDYQFQATLKKVPASAGAVDTQDIKRVTCNGQELSFTGAASASLLALGVSLLVIGALLVLSSRRRPLLRRQ